MTVKGLFEKYKGCHLTLKSGTCGIIVGYDRYNLIMAVTQGKSSWSAPEIETGDNIIIDVPNIGFDYIFPQDIVEGNIKPLQPQLEILIVGDGKQPHQATDGAIGFDTFIREIKYLEDGNYVKVKLGFKTAIPEGYYCELATRSSITDTGWGMCNSEGKIDEDFRGEWQARFRPYKRAGKFPYEVGDRCAQLIFRKKEPFQFKIVDKLSETARGEGGHGHTGLK